jgi:hypothetical protein
MINSLGGCEGYFNQLRSLLRELKTVPEECAIDVKDISIVRTSLRQAFELMIILAWGFNPPDMPGDRIGWFEEPELRLFCDLKKTLTQLYTTDFLKSEIQRLQGTLPGAVDLDPDTLWRSSILSINCQR